MNLDDSGISRKMAEIYEVELTVIVRHNEKSYRIETMRNCKKTGSRDRYGSVTYVACNTSEPNTPPWGGHVWKRFDSSDFNRDTAEEAVKHAMQNLRGKHEGD
jgi:hypothetical protein